jgi:hypothetical protein
MCTIDIQFHNFVIVYTAGERSDTQGLNNYELFETAANNF